MSDTIDDFRDFFKPVKEREIFSISKTVKASLRLLDADFEHNNISVILNEKEEITAFGFLDEYSQVILNLLNNAKDAIGENVKKREIKIDIFSKNKSAVVEIRDSGGGIPDNIINRIFEPYFTTKEGNKGTGIGLYMSKLIIEDHMKGHINVQNAKERAIFKVTTPINHTK